MVQVELWIYPLDHSERDLIRITAVHIFQYFIESFSNLASDWLVALLPANQKPFWNFLLINTNIDMGFPGIPSLASESTLQKMNKWFMWIHLELWRNDATDNNICVYILWEIIHVNPAKLSNNTNNTKHNNIVCTFMGYTVPHYNNVIKCNLFLWLMCLISCFWAKQSDDNVRMMIKSTNWQIDKKINFSDISCCHATIMQQA